MKKKYEAPYGKNDLKTSVKYTDSYGLKLSVYIQVDASPIVFPAAHPSVKK